MLGSPYEIGHEVCLVKCAKIWYSAECKDIVIKQNCQLQCTSVQREIHLYDMSLCYVLSL